MCFWGSLGKTAGIVCRSRRHNGVFVPNQHKRELVRAEESEGENTEGERKARAHKSDLFESCLWFSDRRGTVWAVLDNSVFCDFLVSLFFLVS